MKKRILFLLLALLMLLSACAGPASPNGTAEANKPNVELTVMGDSNPMPGFDAQNKYGYWPRSSFQETDTAFIGTVTSNPYLRYYDKKTGISGFLCADPSCTHDSVSCGAKTSHGASLCWYNGQRWWISDNRENGSPDRYLCRSDLSGMNQEKIKRIAYGDIIAAYGSEQFAIHRGNLFLRGSANVVLQTKPAMRYSLLASPLDSTEEFVVLFDQTLEAPAQNSVRFVGTKVYYTLIVSDRENKTYTITIQTYDLATKEYTTVYTESGIKEWLGEPWVTESGDIYLGGLDTEGENGFIGYLWHLENGKREEVVCWEGEGEKYFRPDVLDGMAVNITIEDGYRGYDIRDFSGNVICQGDRLFPDEIPGIEGNPHEYSYNVVGGDREKLILQLAKANLKHIVMLDVQNGMQPTVLWSSDTRNR